MRRAGVHLTAEQIAEAKQLIADGWRYARIEERLGVSYEVIKRAVDAEYAGNRNREARQRRAPYKRPAGRENASGASVKEDAAARLAEIPRDTRTLTQRLCGDPIPNDPRRERRTS